MNICLVSYEFPPVIGGEGMYTYGLSKALSSLGHDVTVITTDFEGKMDPSVEEDLGVIRVSPVKNFPFKLHSFGTQVRKKLKEEKLKNEFDVVHFTNDFLYVDIPRDEARFPIISTIHHPWGEERKKLKDLLGRYRYLEYILSKKVHFLECMEKKTCENSDRIITVSKYTANCIIRDFGISESKIQVIPNTVDTVEFNPSLDRQVMRDKWNVDTGPVVLFVGRLDFHKGLEYLIISFSRLLRDVPNAKLVIVGEGPLKNKINNRIKERDLVDSVILTGRVSGDALPLVYAASDVFVLPSFMEGFGIVLIEAMACGKPCIGTRVGGIEEVIVDKKSGFIVPPGDASELYFAMKTLIDDESLAKEFGTFGRRRVEENFTGGIVAKKTIDLYKKCRSQ